MYTFYKDYRKTIPKTVVNALSFHLLFLLVPAITLIAYASVVLGVDLSFMKNILHDYIKDDYATIVLNIINSASFSSLNLFVLGYSFLIVCKSMRQIYDVASTLFDFTFTSKISYFIYVLKITGTLFLAIIGFAFALAIEPVSFLIDALYDFLFLRYVLIFLFLVLIYLSLYHFIPKVKIKIRHLCIGALFSASSLTLLYYILIIYFRFSNFQNIYGPLSSIIVVLFVFDLSSEIFYFGMYLISRLYKGELKL